MPTWLSPAGWSGMTCASNPIIDDSRLRNTSQQPPTAAGSSAARQLPAGTMNFRGLKVPPFTGVLGSSHDLTITNMPP